MKPLISILVPIYNAGAFLQECIDSIRRQTYPNLQICLVNDGSTDDSDEICRAYLLEDPRIQYISKPNQGVAATRNRLLDMAKGDYFLFVDADDWIEPDMVEFMLGLIQKNQADIACCKNVISKNPYSQVSTLSSQFSYLSSNITSPSLSSQISDLSSNITSPSLSSQFSDLSSNISDLSSNTWNQRTAIEKFLFHKELTGSLWNKLIDTRLLNKEPDIQKKLLRFDPEISYGEDALFCWHLLQNMNKMVVSDRQLYHYRMNPYSISHNIFGEKKLTGFKVWEHIALDTKKHYPEFVYIAKARWGWEMAQLLLAAAKSSAPHNSDIRKLQKLVRSNFGAMRKAQITSKEGLLFSWTISRSYPLGKLIASRL